MLLNVNKRKSLIYISYSYFTCFCNNINVYKPSKAVDVQNLSQENLYLPPNHITFMLHLYLNYSFLISFFLFNGT